MRKIIVSEFLSLDGVMEGPGPVGSFKYAGWTMGYNGGEKSHKFKLDELFASDALLLGQVTYEGFSHDWPGATDEVGFADQMNSMPKYVVSDTLTSASWNNSHIIRGQDLVRDVQKLKQEPGKDIIVFGSAVLTQSLVQHNLVDQYNLMIYPILLGTGKRLFKEGTHAKLKLIQAQTFDSGVILLQYQADHTKADQPVGQ